MEIYRILLVGGGGFIGAHLAEVLISAGHEVVVLGRSGQPRHRLISEARYVTDDYGDLSTLRGLLDDCSAVVHLAYASVPNTSFDNPLADLLGNLPPSLQLFQEVANRELRLLLVSSGGAIYGERVNSLFERIIPHCLSLPGSHKTDS